MSDNEETTPTEPVETAPPEPVEPVSVEPDPGEIPTQTVIASDDFSEPDPGPITLEEEWRGRRSGETKNDD